MGVAEPAGDPRLELLDQVGADVQPAGAGAAAQVLDRAAAGERHAEVGHVDGEGADRLVAVEDHVGADRGRAGRDLLDVLDEGRAEDHVLERHHQRALVDRGADRVGVDRGAVGRGHQLDHRAAPLLGLPHVRHGREHQALVHDLGARAGVVEARRQHRHHRRDVLVHRDRAGRGRQQPLDAGGGAADLGDPLVPGGDRPGLPEVEVLGQVLLGLGRHAAERVRDEVDALLERGEPGPPGQQRIVDEGHAGPERAGLTEGGDRRGPRLDALG